MRTDTPEPPPLATVFPDVKTSDSTNQGSVEHYIYSIWLPFWESLDSAARERYLDRWQVSEEWRQYIAECYGPWPFDLAAEARESEAYLAEWRKSKPKETMTGKLRRLLGM